MVQPRHRPPPARNRTRERPRARSAAARRLAAALLCSLAAFAGRAEERLRFEHLTTDDGLSSGIVWRVLQDHRGFMWFGTWGGGLDRYDGYDFVSFAYDPDDPGSLGGNEIKALLEDRQGTLWVGTNHGLSRFDRRRQRFTNFVHDPGDPHSIGPGDVWSILEDGDGVLWMVTEGGGLNRFDLAAGGRFERYRHDADDPASLSSDDGRAIAEDHLGYLWIGTPDAGLNRFDPATGEVRRYRHDPDDPTSLSGDDVWSIFEDHRQELWLGTRTRGLNRFDREKDRFVRYLPDRQTAGSLAGGFVVDLREDRDRTLWLAVYDAGLHRYDRERDRFVSYLPDATDPHSLSLFQITSVFEDSLGALWVGTYGSGVERVDRDASKFQVYEHRPGHAASLGGKDVRVVHEDQHGVLWIGTYDGGLTRFDRRSGTYAFYRHDPHDARSLSDNRIHSLIEGRRGYFWIGTWGGGLNRFDPRRPEAGFRRYQNDPRDPQSLSMDDVRALYEDSEGNVWAATQIGGLNRLDPETERFERFLPDAADARRIGTSPLNTLTASPERGILWLGLWGGGLNAFELATGEVRRYENDVRDAASISSNDVFTIYRRADGTLWIGTGAGLDHFDPDTGVFRRYRGGDGLDGTPVYEITQDETGSLWFTTGAGSLARFDPGTGESWLYDQADGVTIGDLQVSCALRSRDGEIFFGGKQGLLFFRPEDVTVNAFVPPVVLTDFRIFNRPVTIGADGSPLAQAIEETEHLTLSHRDSVVTLAFAALNFRAPHKNLYAYRLEGLEEEWNDVGAGRRYATYTNLDPGRYTFQVRGSNNDGVWNETPRSLAIRVLPPYWATWWFRGLAVLTLGAAICGVFLLRTASIRAHNQRLQKEVRERQRAEQQLEKLISELGQKTEALEAQNEILEAQKAELERFSYTVSHDLKTPLVTIQGFVGLLEDDLGDTGKEAVQHHIDIIRGAAGNMHRLLQDLLELSRIGRVVHPPEPVALDELAHEAVAQAAQNIRTHDVEVVIDEPMPQVYGDRLRLLEVLQNLVDNAIKFAGGQAAPRIELGARPASGEVHCWVLDNGIGIEPQYQEQIFGLFERLDPSIDGTGVGLALVKRIVEFHGGRVWVESDGPGQGTAFHLTLPAPPS